MSFEMIDLADKVARVSGTDAKKCMKCGKCSATCPSYTRVGIRPHRFVMMVEDGKIEPLLQTELLWKCLSCFACVERCPRGVEPGKLVEAVRQNVIRTQGMNYKTPGDIPAYIEQDEDIPQQLITSALRKYSK